MDQPEFSKALNNILMQSVSLFKKHKAAQMAVKLLIESFEQIKEIALRAEVEEDAQPALMAFASVLQLLTKGWNASEPGIR